MPRVRYGDASQELIVELVGAAQVSNAMPVNVEEADVVVETSAAGVAEDADGLVGTDEDVEEGVEVDVDGEGLGAVVVGLVVRLAVARTASTGLESAPQEASTWTF
jgi:hypothetical protein